MRYFDPRNQAGGPNRSFAGDDGARDRQIRAHAHFDRPPGDRDFDIDIVIGSIRALMG